MVAAVVARSASFCAAWRIERGDLGAVLGHLVEQERTLRSSTCTGSASSGGESRPIGSSPPASAARSRAISSRSASESRSAGVRARPAFMVGSSSMSTSPALTPARRRRGWRAPRRSRTAGSPWCGRSARSCPARTRRCRSCPTTPRPARRRTAAMIDRADRAADRRRRRLDDFERRRQERQLVAARSAGVETDDAARRIGGRCGFSGLHGCPACKRCKDA